MVAKKREAKRPIVRAPVVGDYITDGKRLVQVLGIDRDGRYECEDARSEALVYIEVHELSRWREVASGDPGS